MGLEPFDEGIGMTALVLMKALPFTKGHEALIRFASTFGPVTVLMDYAPDEPLVKERKKWIEATIPFHAGRFVRQIPVTPQSEEDDPRFWEIWTEILSPYKDRYDYVVGSEPYCERVAQIIGAEYIPFDPDRTLFPTKAANIREEPPMFYSQMSHEVQKFFRTRVTVWGAESTGKTTLSRALALHHRSPWVHEYARPYLTAKGPEITVESMEGIWYGQYATEQLMIDTRNDSPLIVQDTDLYSTIGYWEQPHWSHLGPVPEGLIQDAEVHRSDLYLITPSDIPFEADPLRYGGDHRESSDEYWISVAKKYDLNYVVLGNNRKTEALDLIEAMVYAKTDILRYDRKGK